MISVLIMMGAANSLSLATSTLSEDSLESVEDNGGVDGGVSTRGGEDDGRTPSMDGECECGRRATSNRGRHRWKWDRTARSLSRRLRCPRTLFESVQERGAKYEEDRTACSIR